MKKTILPNIIQSPLLISTKNHDIKTAEVYKHSAIKIFGLCAAILCLSHSGLSCAKQTKPSSITPQDTATEKLAFPGAEGYGKLTTGGRGGKVIKVTNLEDDGAGSFRHALMQKGPRIIVFEVSGTIDLKRRIQIKNGDLTIAGQTAPGDGICIKNYDITVDADNVIIRFMRFRLGDLTKQQTDALSGRHQQNMMIDHCSMSWSIDECASFYANKNFTMQWCIIAESLNQSFHDKNDHGYGAIWGGHQATFHHNLLAHNNSRNPRFDGGNRPGTGGLSPVGIDKVDFRNNVMYNWHGNSVYGGENGEYNMVNNYYKPGPATPKSNNRRIIQVYKDKSAIHTPGYGTFYIHGNYVVGNAAVTQNNWSGGIDYDTTLDQNLVQKKEAFPSEKLRTQHSAEEAFKAVLAKAGASYKRDAVDLRIINDVKRGTATFKGSKTQLPGIIDSQTDVGGWPELAQLPVLTDTDGDGMPDAWELANGLNPHAPDANGKNLSRVYDNIEVYINSLVNDLY
ncbi:pectate lyase [Sphingobacterium deserti]|uniref:Pectate lyase n=1 Tax=Sphingobacterium deserti TaxID=1229276 RepID=A0A0B8T7M4_9SPHI|nr:pectate lyase [Sphingobacterium deserti]KGE13740.1 hypothetical protein DI53_2480 [Sphingobacterium deserti]